MDTLTENAASDAQTSRSWGWRWHAKELLQSPYVFLAAPIVVFGWAIAEPAFNYSHIHQSGINAITTAILGIVLAIQMLGTKPRHRKKS